MYRNRILDSGKEWLPALGSLLLLVGAFHACAQNSTAIPPCESTVTGTLDILPVTSNIFSNTRNLRVWLPQGYQDPANLDTSYPVLYLLDGEMLFDHCTAPRQSAEWRVDETLTTLIASHSVEPLIVVGIDSTGRSRAHEFAPY